MLSTMNLRDFTNDLASNSPAPGGGSVAALSAALASSLTSMVFNLTIGKKVYNNYDEEIKIKIKENLECAVKLKDDFMSSMEEDTKVFMELMAAFKLPKETEEEKAFRKREIAKAYKVALDVPYSLAKASFGLYDSILVAAEYGNINAISDAGVAALMLQSAIESAVLNVNINLSSMEDGEEKDKIRICCRDLVEEGRVKRDKILDITNSKIG